MKKIGQFLFLIVVLFTYLVMTPCSYALTNTNETFKKKWKGFERINLRCDGKEAHLTCPEKPLPGNPWLWRGRFPDYHAEIDSVLLSKGFYVAYVNTENQFGSPKAIAVWNKFYKQLQTEFQTKKKL